MWVSERKNREEHPVTSAYRLKYVCAHCGTAGAGLDFEADPDERDSGYYKCRRCHLYVDPHDLLGIGVRIDRPACAKLINSRRRSGGAGRVLSVDGYRRHP